MTNSPPNPPEQQEHVLKGMPRLRYRHAEDSLEDARTSLRRWWWEFLRLSKDYWLVCQTSKGRPRAATEDELLRRVHRDFGDIYSCSFDEWWLDRGYRLFSEVEPFPKVKEVAKRLNERERQAPGDDKIWVEIPLKLSKRTIQKQLGKLLDQHASDRLSRRMELTTAEFRINTAQFGLHTLKKVHELHALHRELIDKPKWLAQQQPKKVKSAARADLFRLGTLLRISPSNESLKGEPDEIRARQNRMRVSVSRILKRSEQLIANVEQGIFPSYQSVSIATPRFTARQLAQHKELEAQWWELNLISELSAEKLAAVSGIRYIEPERTRQNNLTVDRRERRVIYRDA
jgi:hypothetical protein